jgi:hypothetical protein
MVPFTTFGSDTEKEARMWWSSAERSGGGVWEGVVTTSMDGNVVVDTCMI